MKICPTCNEMINENDKICIKCGKILEPTVVNEIPQVSNIPTNNIEPIVVNEIPQVSNISTNNIEQTAVNEIPQVSNIPTNNIESTAVNEIPQVSNIPTNNIEPIVVNEIPQVSNIPINNIEPTAVKNDINSPEYKKLNKESKNKKIIILLVLVVMLAIAIFIIILCLNKSKNKADITTLPKDSLYLIKSPDYDSNDTKYIFVSTDGKIVEFNDYSYIGDFSNGAAVAQKKDEERKILINSSGNVLVDSTKYDDINEVGKNLFSLTNLTARVFIVEKDDKYGLIDAKGKEITPIIYDDIDTFSSMPYLFKVEKDYKYGVINDEGKELIPIELDDDEIKIYIKEYEPESSILVMQTSNKFYVINYETYEKPFEITSTDAQVYFDPNHIIDNTNNKTYFFDKNGKEILTLNSSFVVNNYLENYGYYNTCETTDYCSHDEKVYDKNDNLVTEKFNGLVGKAFLVNDIDNNVEFYKENKLVKTINNASVLKFAFDYTDNELIVLEMADNNYQVFKKNGEKYNNKIFYHVSFDDINNVIYLSDKENIEQYNTILVGNKLIELDDYYSINNITYYDENDKKIDDKYYLLSNNNKQKLWDSKKNTFKDISINEEIYYGIVYNDIYFEYNNGQNSVFYDLKEQKEIYKSENILSVIMRYNIIEDKQTLGSKKIVDFNGKVIHENNNK